MSRTDRRGLNRQRPQWIAKIQSFDNWHEQRQQELKAWRDKCVEAVTTYPQDQQPLLIEWLMRYCNWLQEWWRHSYHSKPDRLPLTLGEFWAISSGLYSTHEQRHLPFGEIHPTNHALASFELTGFNPPTLSV